MIGTFNLPEHRQKKVEYQERFVELERTRELSKQLMYTVEPLQEDGTAFVHIICCCALSTTIGELVSKLQPLLLHQNTETLSHSNASHILK